MSQISINTSSLLRALELLSKKGGYINPKDIEVSVDSNGLITARVWNNTSTYQLAFQEAKTVTPSFADIVAVPSGYYTGGNITVAGDSNLVAENIKSGVSIFGVNGTLVEGSGGGSGDLVDYSENEDGIITGNLASYTNNRITTIRSYAFECYHNLKTVDFPVCENIGDSAFRSCSSLTSANFPVCTKVGSYAFQSCSSLVSIGFPACTSIESYAFQSCSSLASISFPACASIKHRAFGSCIGLTSVNFPACKNIGSNAFEYCTNLTYINFPICTNISNNAFQSCYKLKSASFSTRAEIMSNVFKYCYKLSELYLMDPSKVCNLYNSNAFSSTPYAGYSSSFSGYPVIYVPFDLLSSYKKATNWTYFSSYMIGI